jgi:hypothetical protein
MDLGCKVFFTRAQSATVQDAHLTITVPKGAVLVDDAYLDDTNDLPFEVRCDSELDQIALAYHLRFRPGSHAIEKLDDARFDLLQISDKLGSPMRICILRRSDPGKSYRPTQSYDISSAEIKLSDE